MDWLFVFTDSYFGHRDVKPLAPRYIWGGGCVKINTNRS